MGSRPGGEGSSMGSSSRGAAPSRAIKSRCAKSRIRSRFGLRAAGAGLIPRHASRKSSLGRDLGWGRRRFRLRK